MFHLAAFFHICVYWIYISSDNSIIRPNTVKRRSRALRCASLKCQSQQDSKYMCWWEYVWEFVCSFNKRCSGVCVCVCDCAYGIRHIESGSPSHRNLPITSDVLKGSEHWQPVIWPQDECRSSLDRALTARMLIISLLWFDEMNSEENQTRHFSVYINIDKYIKASVDKLRPPSVQ